MQGQRIILGIAALWGLAGVAMLAAGGHMDPRMGTAGSFLLFHAVAVVALLNTQLVSGWKRALPMALLLLGPALFAFEIALHVTAGVTQLAMLAPIGGTVAMLGWLVLAVAAFSSRSSAA